MAMRSQHYKVQRPVARRSHNRSHEFDAPRDKAEASRLDAAFYFRKPSRLDEFMRLGELLRLALKIEEPGKPDNAPS
jgi:hypothetical protein